jgi:hypothetical protein
LHRYLHADDADSFGNADYRGSQRKIREDSRSRRDPHHPRANLLDLDFADIGKLLTDGKNLGELANRIYFCL